MHIKASSLSHQLNLPGVCMCVCLYELGLYELGISLMFWTFLLTRSFRYGKSILVLHMALFEVALESRLKKIEPSGSNKKCRLSPPGPWNCTRHSFHPACRMQPRRHSLSSRNVAPGMLPLKSKTWLNMLNWPLTISFCHPKVSNRSHRIQKTCHLYSPFGYCR